MLLEEHLLSTRAGTGVSHAERTGVALADGTSSLERKMDSTQVAGVRSEGHKSGI